MARRNALDETHREFMTMLVEARQALERAMDARLGRAQVPVACLEVIGLEQRADEAEIRLRRQLLVHATVHGAGDIPACLIYMSIAKDAERISDLAVGICQIAERIGPPPSPALEDLDRLGRSVVDVLKAVPGVIDREDSDQARELVKQARAAQQACSARLDDVVRGEAGEHVLHVDQVAESSDEVQGWHLLAEQPVALALTYRHLGRIAANALNVISSLVVPLDRLDYPFTSD